MEVRRGVALFWQQYSALVRKNAIVTWRNKRSAAVQLLASLFFIFLIFCIDRAMLSRFGDYTAYKNIHDPVALVAPPIPPCEEKFFIKTDPPCFDFLWSGNSSSRIASIVGAIMANNPGRPIPSHKVWKRAYSSSISCLLSHTPSIDLAFLLFTCPIWGRNLVNCDSARSKVPLVTQRIGLIGMFCLISAKFFKPFSRLCHLILKMTWTNGC